MGIPNIINGGKCVLKPVNSQNVGIVKTLFHAADVKKYYVLRADHAQNIDSFCQYIISANMAQEAINLVIYNDQNIGVGLISAEPVMNRNTGIPVWNVGYAILPNYRNRGYASAALKGLTNFLLQNFSLPQVMLDISDDNTASEEVAKKCGFTKPNDRTGYFDWEHPEIGMRFRWFKQLTDQRTMYFNQACQLYRQKAYPQAIQAFNQALKEPYQPGTSFTDAQIYSNLGMALSSVRQYREAFNALKKAQSLGLNNPSIEKELLWLRNNQGIY